MYVGAKIYERRSPLSVAEAMQLMIDFGSLVISLISLVVVLIKLNDDNKK